MYSKKTWAASSHTNNQRYEQEQSNAIHNLHAELIHSHSNQCHVFDHTYMPPIKGCTRRASKVWLMSKLFTSNFGILYAIYKWLNSGHLTKYFY